MTTFAERLRQARLLRRCTQKSLAQACGLSQGAIGNYESGSRACPSADILIRLTYALEVLPAWLGAGVGPMFSDGKQDWPFDSIAFADYMKLSLAEKRQLEALLAAYIANRSL